MRLDLAKTSLFYIQSLGVPEDHAARSKLEYYLDGVGTMASLLPPPAAAELLRLVSDVKRVADSGLPRPDEQLAPSGGKGIAIAKLFETPRKMRCFPFVCMP
jgi:hypothetical protein